MRSSLGKEIRDEVKCIQWDPLSMDYFLVSRQISGKPIVYLKEKRNLVRKLFKTTNINV